MLGVLQHLPRVTVRPHRALQSAKLLPPQTPVTSSRPLILLPTWLQITSSYNPLLRCDNQFDNLLAKLRKILSVLFYYHWFIIKGSDAQPDEEARGAGPERSCALELGMCRPPCPWSCSPSWFLRRFYCIDMIDQNHCSTVMDSTFRPSPLSGGKQVRLNIPTLLSHDRFLWQSTPSSKSHLRSMNSGMIERDLLWMTKKDSSYLYHSEMSVVLLYHNSDLNTVEQDSKFEAWLEKEKNPHTCQ